jgi:hypothetical protein
MFCNLLLITKRLPVFFCFSIAFTSTVLGASLGKLHMQKTIKNLLRKKISKAR